ncbi:MAG: hypothetical protein IPO24_18370 [Bacteroidetes bacterium]|nr:hypothetical protein [Bacteroidota bacterium]
MNLGAILINEMLLYKQWLFTNGCGVTPLPYRIGGLAPDDANNLWMS